MLLSVDDIAVLSDNEVDISKPQHWVMNIIWEWILLEQKLLYAEGKKVKKKLKGQTVEKCADLLNSIIPKEEILLAKLLSLRYPLTENIHNEQRKRLRKNLFGVFLYTAARL